MNAISWLNEIISFLRHRRKKNITEFKMAHERATSETLTSKNQKKSFWWEEKHVKDLINCIISYKTKWLVVAYTLMKISHKCIKNWENRRQKSIRMLMWPKEEHRGDLERKWKTFAKFFKSCYNWGQVRKWKNCLWVLVEVEKLLYLRRICKDKITSIWSWTWWLC